jgi:hypothetical protein
MHRTRFQTEKNPFGFCVIAVPPSPQPPSNKESNSTAGGDKHAKPSELIGVTATRPGNLLQRIASPQGTSPSATIRNTPLTKEAHPGRATGQPLALRLALGAGQTASRMRAAVPLARVFERHAETCTRAAEQTSHRTHRARLIRLAAYWRQVAQDLRQASDRNESPREQPAPGAVEPLG